MMHKSWLHIPIFFALALVGSMSPASQRLCLPASKVTVSEQSRAYGRDPAGVVKKATNVLHNQFKEHNKNLPNQIFQDVGDLRIQMSVLYNYFSLGDWTTKISQIKEAAILDSMKSSELDYVFTHWLRARYLSTVRELIRERELTSVFRNPADAATQKTVVSHPAELVVTGYAPFTCSSDWDQMSYDCSKKYVFVTTQLSPRVLCSHQRLASQARFLFLVDVSGPKFKITDVEYSGNRLYQDALIDLSFMLKSKKDPDTVIRTLKLWSYKDTKPTQKEELQAFQQQLFRNSKMNQKSGGRMPASTN